MRIAALIAGTLFALSYSGCALFSHGIENCTQGDTDSYLFGLFFCVPLAVGAPMSFYIGRGAHRVASFVVFSLVWVVGLCAAFDLVPWALSTLVSGHHPCGPDYNDYIPYMRPIDPYVPLIYIVLLNFVVLSPLLVFIPRPGRAA
jgi:hypothetical protein